MEGRSDEVRARTLAHPATNTHPAAARSALVLPTAALAAAAAAPVLLPRGWAGPPPGAAGAVAGWRAGVLCAFVWTMGAHILEVRRWLPWGRSSAACLLLS